MANLYPYLFSTNAREQAAFYAEALNGEIRSIQTFEEAPGTDDALHDKVMHLVLQAAGQTFFMADDVASDKVKGTNLDLTLEFEQEEDARMAFNGLSQGGSILMPFEKMFWGAMFGRVEDRYGVRWQISTVQS
ncbi:VOC family protein [Pontibacillus salicampi]|uniref:VOC family protein n=1 Tax=Pontibacillus salicampi TaxID=1449801 RepID=A0ABV6LNT5_9BACI